jgi:hypothetical protein
MTLVEPEKKSMFRRLIDDLRAWAMALDYSGAEYTLDRIAGLEKQVAELREELRRALPRS